MGGRSSSSSSGSGDRRRRHRDKKSKRSDKKHESDKKRKHSSSSSKKADKRPRSPVAPAQVAPVRSSALQDIDIDAALEAEDAEYRLQIMMTMPKEKPAVSQGQLVVVGSQSNALTLVPPAELVAPDANSEKIRSLAHVARESRRVHLSHLPPDIDQEQLRSTFRDFCAAVRREMINLERETPLPDDCVVDIDDVVDVYLNTRSATPFAFVELTTDDMCTRLIAGDLPIEFPGGRRAKVGCRRPRDYKPMITVDSRRIHLLGIDDPESYKEAYKTVVETVGEVQLFAVIPHRGFYVEYAREEDAVAACSELNGKMIGGRVVIAQPTSEAIRAWYMSLDIPVTGLFDGSGCRAEAGDLRRELLGQLLNLQTNLNHSLETFSAQYEHLRGSWPVIFPTRILCLFNVIDRAELDEDDDSYNNLVQDVEEEVEKYGRVKRLIIPRMVPKPPMPPEEYVAPKKPVPPVGSAYGMVTSGEIESAALVDPTADTAYREELARWEMEVKEGESTYQAELDEYCKARAAWDAECMHPVLGTPGLGRIFVEYETVDEAENAQARLAGRLFNGRTIVTSFLFEDVLYPPPADDEDDGDGPKALLTVAAPPASAPLPAEESTPALNDDID